MTMLRRWNAAAQQSARGHACGDLAAAPHMQLGENAVNMILDRCVPDAQLARDLLVGKALRHQRDDLVLAPRQRAVICAMAAFGAYDGDAAKQQGGDARRTNELVAHGAVYRRHQILNRAVAGDES
jgi:siderophore synthetase component